MKNKYLFLAILCAMLMVLGDGHVLHAQDHGMAAPESAAGNASEAGRVGALARIEPASRVITLAPPNNMDGSRIQSWRVQEGDDVKKGDVIGIFGHHERELAQKQLADARVKVAEANLIRVRQGNKKADIEAQKAQVNATIAVENSARKEYERVSEMYKDRAISKARYDMALADYQRAQAQRKSAQEMLDSLMIVRPDDIQIAEAQVAEARAQAAVAAESFALSEIRAPIDGTVLKIYSFGGEAPSNSGIVDIADLSAFDAVAEVFENDITKVKVGQKALVTVPSIKDPIEGTVYQVGWQVGKNNIVDNSPTRLLDTRVVEVRVRIDPKYTSALRHLINVKSQIVIQ